MNLLVEYAKDKGRNYDALHLVAKQHVTPEDITDILQDRSQIDKVRLDLPEVLGRQTDIGCEDYSLYCFIAWEGR